MTTEEILKKYCIKNYAIREDGTVDVDGDVNLSNKKLTKIPVKFGKVTGNLDLSNNQISDLTGLPQSIGGYLDISNNTISNLIIPKC